MRSTAAGGRIVPNRNDDDLELCTSAAKGDQLAFTALVARHERPLRSFLARMASPDVTDDIAQEAFLKAWRSVSSYDGRARFSTWLTRIAWRCLIDEARRTRRRPEQSNAEPSADGVGAAEVADMLARLPPNERAALVLCEGHGWSHSEAAELLQMPLGTLKTVVARAKSKCREMWSLEYADD
jgi:RNA polymerase sigma factor (sigma-70 family)